MKQSLKTLQRTRERSKDLRRVRLDHYVRDRIRTYMKSVCRTYDRYESITPEFLYVAGSTVSE